MIDKEGELDKNITAYMQQICFPKEKWKTIDRKRDLDLAMWYEGKVLYVNFEGSDSIKDWIFNFFFTPIKVPYKNMEDVYYTHSGFTKLYHVVRDDIHKKFKKHKDVEKIMIMGHSLGGALATLCYADFMWHKEKREGYDVKIVGVASGSPRVGWKKGFDNFEKYTKDLIRPTYASDIITQVPPKIFGFKHTGEEKHFGPRRKKPLFPAALYKHYRVAYLNYLKDNNHKDGPGNNKIYLIAIILYGLLYIGLISLIVSIFL